MRLHIKQPQLSKWERDINSPGARALTKIADAYGVTVGELMAHSESAMAPLEPGGTITISRDDAFYYRGVLDSELRNLANVSKSIDALGESLRALRGMLTSATDGMASIAAANVLPPRPKVSAREVADVLEVDATVAAAAAKRTADAGKEQVG